MKNCLSGATISVKTACMNLYATGTNTRRLTSSSTATRETCNAIVTMTSLGADATKNAETARVRVNSVLQIPSGLKTTLAVKAATRRLKEKERALNSGGTIIYGIDNQGERWERHESSIEQERKSFVCEQLKKMVKSSNPSLTEAVSGVGVINAQAGVNLEISSTALQSRSQAAKDVKAAQAGVTTRTTTTTTTTTAETTTTTTAETTTTTTAETTTTGTGTTSTTTTTQGGADSTTTTTTGSVSTAANSTSATDQSTTSASTQAITEGEGETRRLGEEFWRAVGPGLTGGVGNGAMGGHVSLIALLFLGWAECATPTWEHALGQLVVAAAMWLVFVVIGICWTSLAPFIDFDFRSTFGRYQYGLASAGLGAGLCLTGIYMMQCLTYLHRSIMGFVDPLLHAFEMLGTLISLLDICARWAYMCCDGFWQLMAHSFNGVLIVDCLVSTATVGLGLLEPCKSAMTCRDTGSTTRRTAINMPPQKDPTTPM
eukprot:g32797.t1